MANYIWVVWLNYPGQERRFSCAFSNEKAARKYAIIPDEEKPFCGYVTTCTKEPVYKTIEEVS